MATATEGAALVLKLYELRRETVMREARNWFLLEFHPSSVDEVRAALQSDKSPYFRMVLSYWEMAAALVSHGAIDAKMFLDTTGEAISVFAKLQPMLPELREAYGSPDYLVHLENLIKDLPGIEERMEKMRNALREASSQGANQREPETAVS